MQGLQQSEIMVTVKEFFGASNLNIVNTENLLTAADLLVIFINWITKFFH